MSRPPFAHTVAHKWLAGTSLQGATPAFANSSTYGSAAQSIDRMSGERCTLEPLEAVLAGLHTPNGVACVLHHSVAPVEVHGVVQEKTLRSVDLRALRMSIDYLAVLMLDVVDASTAAAQQTQSQPLHQPNQTSGGSSTALESNIDGACLWPLLHTVMTWCIQKVVEQRIDPQPAFRLLPMLACGARLLLPLRLVHLHLGPIGANEREAQIQTWVKELVVERQHAKAHGTLHKDDFPSAVLDLQLAHLHAGVSSLLGVTRDGAEIAGGGALPAARMLPFATVEPDAGIFIAMRTLLDGEPSELFDESQQIRLYHALAITDTWALRAQCMLATATKRSAPQEVHEATNRSMLHRIEEMASLLNPVFASSHVARDPAPADHTLLNMPWEPAASYALLISDVFLREVLSRTSSEPLTEGVIDHLVRGSRVHATPAEPQVVGLIDMLAYSSAGAPTRHKEHPFHWWPAARMLDWVADFCDDPRMLLKQAKLEVWVFHGVEMLKRDVMASMGTLRWSLVEYAAANLTRGMLQRLGDQYSALAPPGKSVLIAPSGERTRKIVDLLDVSVHVHDTCKGLLRTLARPAVTAALLLEYPVKILRVFERLLRHPLIMAWPKKFTAEIQARLRFLRHAIEVMNRLRDHAALTVERLAAANRALDSHVGEQLAQLRAHLLSPGTDFTSELRRRSALHKAASITQQLITQLRFRFVTQQGEHGKRHKASHDGDDGIDAVAASVAALKAEHEGAAASAARAALPVQQERAADDLAAFEAASAVDESLCALIECTEGVTSVCDTANLTDAFGFTVDEKALGRVHHVDILAAKSAEIMNATAQLLELARTEIKPIFERIYESATGQLQGLEEAALGKLDLNVADEEDELGIGSLQDVGGEFAAQVVEQTMAMAFGGEASAAAGAGSRAAKTLWAKRRGKSKAAKSKDPSDAAGTHTHGPDVCVREVAAWCALRVKTALDEQLKADGCRVAWRQAVQPIRDELVKAIYCRRIDERDEGVRRALCLDECAAQVNAACKSVRTLETSIEDDVEVMEASQEPFEGVVGAPASAANDDDYEAKSLLASAARTPLYHGTTDEEVNWQGLPTAPSRAYRGTTSYADLVAGPDLMADDDWRGPTRLPASVSASACASASASANAIGASHLSASASAAAIAVGSASSVAALPPSRPPPSEAEQIDALKAELIRLRGEHLLLKEQVHGQSAPSEPAVRATRRGEPPEHVPPSALSSASPPMSYPPGSPPPSPPPSPPSVPSFQPPPSVSLPRRWRPLARAASTPGLRRTVAQASSAFLEPDVDVQRVDENGVPMARPLLDMLSDEATRMLAGTALAKVEVELSREISSLEKLQKSVHERGQQVVIWRRDERTETKITSAQKLHAARSLAATSQIVRALTWMQQKLIECRLKKAEVSFRMNNAWQLVESERLRTHLLDVLEARVRAVDHVSMQNMVDCEHAWLLGKTAVPTRTGGGFHRAGSKLMHETEWLHNLEIRDANVRPRFRGPSVAPPMAPGLRYEPGYRGTIASPLWPDAVAAKAARLQPGASKPQALASGRPATASSSSAGKFVFGSKSSKPSSKTKLESK